MGIGVNSLGRRRGEDAGLVCAGMGEGAESRLYSGCCRPVIEVSVPFTNMSACARISVLTSHPQAPASSLSP